MQSIMFIKNRSELESDKLDENQLEMRKIALNCLEKALHAVKPENLIEKNLSIEDKKLFIKDDSIDLDKFDKIYIIGAGKASAGMLSSLEKILREHPNLEYEGIINVNEGLEISQLNLTNKVKINYAPHPIPSQKGLDGTQSMLKLIENATKRDLILCLISGGGSALLLLPKKGITLDELKELNSLLLESGASIQEINCVRKHLSDVKGGNLAKTIYESSGATLISLIISDVIGDELDTIASGPTVPDLTTYDESIQILKKYGLYKKVSPSIKSTLEIGANDDKLETPKPNDACFRNTRNYLIGSVRFAAHEVIYHLKRFDFTPVYFSNSIVGEAREFGKNLYEIIVQNIDEMVKLDDSKKKMALIGTGELTVTIKGKGIGGRNQEMLLSFLSSILNCVPRFNFLAIAANLDGMEGNSKAMGALVDNRVIMQTLGKKLNPEQYLNQNDSNSFFKSVKTELITGSTGCNVNDMILILISLH